jgi:hypothetical protein
MDGPSAISAFANPKIDDAKSNCQLRKQKHHISDSVIGLSCIHEGPDRANMSHVGHG